MTSTTLQTDMNNDLVLVDGRNLFILDGIDACVQSVRQACLMRLGEDIYNQSTGVDYFGTIFTPQQNYAAARKSIMDAITSVDGVLSIDSISISVSGDVFSFTANINTTFGPTTVSV